MIGVVDFIRALGVSRIAGHGDVMDLNSPPLGVRAADVLALAQHFAKLYALANGVPPLSAEAKRELMTDGVRLDQSKPAAVAHAALAAEAVSRSLVGRTVAEVERDLILETLKHCRGNRTHAAKILGISVRTLRNKLNEYAAEGVPIPAPNGGEVRLETRGVV